MERLNLQEVVQANPEVNQELAAKLIGGQAMEMYAVPIDPMDDLQCESCQ